MTALAHIMLDDAERFVAVANTPIFLARRLREDPAAKRAHEFHGAQAIYSALEGIVARQPATLADAAEVYLYLVALSFDNDLSWLRRTCSLPSPHIKWYQAVGDYLLAVATSTLTMSAQLSTPAPGSLVRDPSRPYVSTSNVHIILHA